jgi:hypothetical protein
MITSIWYSTSTYLPNKSKYYVAWILAQLGGGEDGYSLVWFDEPRKVWRVSPQSTWSIQVSYWADLPDSYIVDQRESVYVMSASEEVAWQRVQDAVRDYNMIKILPHSYAHKI